MSRLQEILHFDPEDLAANRRGELSATQREFFARRAAVGGRSGSGVARLVVILIIVAGATIGLLAAGGSLDTIRDSVDQADAGVALALGIGAASLAMLVVIVVAAGRSHRGRVDDFARAVSNGTLSVVDGRFGYVTEASNVQRGVPESWEANQLITDRWAITLGSRPVMFPHGLGAGDVQALTEMGTCRGYLLSWSQGDYVVSAEPLD